MSKLRKYIDIGANLTDSMYNGVYNGSTKHTPDLEHVLKRSWDSGLENIIITGGSLSDSEKALKIADGDNRLFITVGCHPTHCTDFETTANYLEKLRDFIHLAGKKVAAIGECGLDYDRLHFCPKATQLKYFEHQLILAKSFQLPLFLHCRNAADDLYDIVNRNKCHSGVVHSFDGSLEEAKRFIQLGLHIGINGCSLKTQDNLKVVSEIPKEALLIETDCPWCEIRPSHAGYALITKKAIPAAVKKEKWRSDAPVKNRTEPQHIQQVLEVIAAVKNEDPDALAATIYNNTLKLFKQLQ